jgi:hypothetical protein
MKKIIYNLRKAVFILWDVLPNDKEDKPLTQIIYKLIDIIDNCKGASVSINWHSIDISNEHFNVRLWNANKFYAWCSLGNINDISFDNIRPSRAAMFDFKECLKRNGHNIYIKKPNYALPFDTSSIIC